MRKNFNENLKIPTERIHKHKCRIKYGTQILKSSEVSPKIQKTNKKMV